MPALGSCRLIPTNINATHITTQQCYLTTTHRLLIFKKRESLSVRPYRQENPLHTTHSLLLNSLYCPLAREPGKLPPKPLFYSPGEKICLLLRGRERKTELGCGGAWVHGQREYKMLMERFVDGQKNLYRKSIVVME